MSINIIYPLIDTKFFYKGKILDPVDYDIVGNFGKYGYISRWGGIVGESGIHLRPFLRVSTHIWTTAHVVLLYILRTAYRRRPPAHNAVCTSMPTPYSI